MDKLSFRAQAIEIRKGVQDKEMKSEQIKEALLQLDEYKKAQRIMFYYGVGDEVMTKTLIQTALRDKEVYLPLVKEDVLEAMPLKDLSHLAPGSYQIPEPPEEMGDFKDQIELIIVPGVAFDVRGNRLGMGKGYYDKSLPNYNATTVALAYQEQVVDQVPIDPYDRPVDIIVTENTIHRRS